MFSIFKRRYTLIEAKLFNGLCDYHSHILPAVDDGSHSVEESLDILSWYEELGVRKVVLTPHIMEKYPLNSTQSLGSAFEQFKSQYNGGVELHLGAEHMIDSRFLSHLSSGDMLTLDGDNHLLVEFSFASPPVRLFETLQRIMSSGYFVVLAHPERFLYLTKGNYRRLKEMGVLFQLNLLSLLGGYGERVSRRATELLNLSMYNYLGSDIHSLSHNRKFLTSKELPRSTLAQIERVRRE